jgi:CBS-domain-containing membrane protein
MLIKELMSKPCVTCPADGTLDAVVRLMAEFDIGIVPVVGDDGRLSGVVTDRDVCMAAYARQEPLSKIPVPTAMSKQVIACHMNDAIETVEHLMADNQIRRLPVVDDHGRPIGLVSLNDLSRLAMKAHRIGVDRELVETMAAVGKPRGTVVEPTVQGDRRERLIVRE